MRLVPVVEVYTGVLDAVDGGPLSEPRWDAVYRAAVVAAGLPAPVAAHPWFVAATELRDGPGLATIVRALLDDDDDRYARLADPAYRAEALDEVAALPGGYLLMDGDRCLALPGCCADLGDLAGWRDAAAHRDAAPATLWTGHPWLLASADADLLTLRGPVDSPAATGPEIARIDRQALADSVEAAAADVARFATVLRATCTTIVGTAGAETADRLLGGH